MRKTSSGLFTSLCRRNMILWSYMGRLESDMLCIEIWVEVSFPISCQMQHARPMKAMMGLPAPCTVDCR